MQQELIEMLDKIVEYIVICNEYDQRFSSTSYGANILKDAKRLIEKAKNSAKEPAVPQGEPTEDTTYKLAGEIGYEVAPFDFLFRGKELHQFAAALCEKEAKATP